jgi:hypothetical protein
MDCRVKPGNDETASIAQSRKLDGPVE